MKTDESARYIKDLIRQGENQKLDFKFAINDSKKIAKSLVAFANTDGGTLLVGVKDNGAITGVCSDEEYYMVEAAATLYSKPEIVFQAKSWNVGGKIVFEVIVPKSNQIPHYAQDHDGKWLAYIRHEDKNLLANIVWLKVLERQKESVGQKVQISSKEKFILNYIEENQTITFSKLCKIGDINRFEATEILVNFITWDLIEMVITEKATWYQLKSEKKLK